MTGHTGPLLLFFRALPGASFKLTLSPCSGKRWKTSTRTATDSWTRTST
uniref:Uncharacterized protein n=1 Tax=Anguilla anguilla TaxID=7936 RepID=A0A0E9W0L7_ANGAN